MIHCPLPEIFFGGARGGGKTSGVLGKWALKDQRYGPDFNAVMFRRTTVSAEDAIEESKRIYGPLGGKFNEAKLRWRMPNGGRVAFAYLESVTDAQEYQGRNLTDAWIEEAGQYPSPTPIDRLFGVLRSAAGVPVQMILTGNPGGPGQHWIRDRYQLHPFPRGPKVLARQLANGSTHKVALIPSRIHDNRLLLARDPTYIDRLHLVGSEALVRAWLEGDWSAVEGAFFDCWNETKHVLRPFAIPTEWMRFRSMDWGSASPFSVGWWAVAGEDFRPSGIPGGGSLLSPDPAERVLIPRGALVRYREWYGASSPGVGLKLTAEEVAEGIKDREAGDIGPDGRSLISYGVLDPSAFAQDGGPSIAERMIRKGAMFRPADNKRVSQRGAMGGWDQMRARLKGDGENPALFVFSTCTDFIRTIPVLQHDPDRPEDLDSDSDDHVADDARYGCVSRPYIRTLKPEPPPPHIFEAGSDGVIRSTLTFDQLRDRQAKRRERE